MGFPTLIHTMLLTTAMAGQPGAPRADEPGGDGALAATGRYSLLNPTPRELRRPLSADRPDATESPYPVDAGAVQIELSFIELGIQSEDGETRRSLSFAPVNVKLGLTERVDLQLLFNPYERQEGGGTPDADGVGSFGVRTKINLWGIDGGSSAGALLPYIVFPTGDSDVSSSRIESGLVVPVAFSLEHGWDLGFQAEIALVNDGSGYDTVLAHTAVLGHDIAGDLAGYIEYIGEANLDMGEYMPSLSAGLTYGVNEDTQLDFGVVIGLDNPSAEDVRVFAGITLRF